MANTLVDKLKKWCRGEALDENHALLAVVPVNTEIALIEETLQSIKCLGRVRVRGRMLSDTDNEVLVLCECREKVVAEDVPQEVLTSEGTPGWPLVTAFNTPTSEDDFSVKLKALLQAEGKSLDDVQALFTSHSHLPPLLQSRSFVLSQICWTRQANLRQRVEDIAAYAFSQLRLRERKANPPTFLELLKEIRKEEEYEASKVKLNQSVHTVHAKVQAESKQSEIQNLRAEIKEVKSMFAALATQSQPEVETTEKHSTRPESAASFDPEVQALKKQVKHLQQKVNSKTNKRQSSSQTTVMAVNSPVKPTETEERFCYRCGENGHLAGKCNRPENQNKVIQRLLQALKKAKTGSPQTNAESTSQDPACTVRKSAVDVLQLTGIPEGLIGPPSVEPLKVNGHLCDALLDSGSRVSIIFESWYRKYLSSTPIYPVTKLDIWGLSDSSYPYLGYVVVDMEFPKKVTGAPTIMSVLALICPDPPGPDQTPVIIGTNAKASLSKRLSQLCTDTPGVPAHAFGIQSFCPSSETSNLTATQEEDDGVGFVKWEGPGSLTLSAGSSLKANCTVVLDQPLPKEILMVEASTNSPLPAEVFVQPMVIPSSAIEQSQCTVLIQNESLKNVTLPVGTIIGRLCIADVVTSLPSHESESRAFDTSQINFGESPVPETWKARLCQKLAERATVFSFDELDVGLAKGVSTAYACLIQDHSVNAPDVLLLQTLMTCVATSRNS
ncbi:hypothetical protein WMY93_019004 [Mugilogobius chulae]|uniref:CCHC-type domain-containing protein n=1 Tax=Mugilogobius chulae TaxID=88201 RepID=A0AAW0NPY1_9GOBI